jgi:hypothetical protein
MVFPFDNIVFSSSVYERVFRGSLKASLRRQQNGPLKEPQKGKRDGKDVAAFLAFLGEEERPTPTIGPGTEVSPEYLVQPTSSAWSKSLVNSKLWKERSPPDGKFVLMSSEDSDTRWFLETIKQQFTQSTISQLAVDRTILHCSNLLIAAMENFAIRPEKRSNDNHYKFLTENHPHQSLNAQFVEAIVSIWHDPCISTVLTRSAVLPSMEIVPQ